MSELDDLLTREGITEGAEESAPLSVPPKKKRGRPKGSTNAKPATKAEPEAKLDRRVVFGFVETIFGVVTYAAGPKYAPLDSEKAIIGENLALVLEKRLPDGAIENLPEIALGVGVLSYVARIYLSGPENRPGTSVVRETGVGKDGVSEASIVEGSEGISV